MSSSPWATVASVEPVDFQDIMSEEYARGLQQKENEKYHQHLAQYQTKTNKNDTISNDDDIISHTKEESEIGEASGGGSRDAAGNDDDAPTTAATVDPRDFVVVDDVCESDRVIAEMLQAQFDRDHDLEVDRIEQHHNKNSKVTVSFSKYRNVPAELVYDSEDPEDDELNDPNQHWDRFVPNEKLYDELPKKGFTYDQDGLMVTKHDAQINGVRNACRVMSFPPEFQTGDTAGFDMTLPNSVFNQLKTYSHRTKKSKAQDRRENVATAEMGIDERTRLILYKLVNNQMLQQINGIISTGKEAVILHADSDASYTGELVLPKECAIKVFKTTLNEFKQRDRYIKDDYRFKDRFSKQNNRVVINMWAEKEMHNLMRMQACGISCPNVVQLKKHVLVMSFIGENNVAAPKLKDVLLSDADASVAYEECVKMMHRMYNEAKLVHADLSEYNILWHQGQCWFIDVAQSVEPDHPSALEFLMRDCGNISSVNVAYNFCLTKHFFTNFLILYL